MKIHDVREWFTLAEDDFHAVKLMIETERKPLKIISYHCAQAVEKYLKGFLEYNNIIPHKTHDLIKILIDCISIDDSFKSVFNECEVINDYTNEIRYPYGPQITEDEVFYLIKCVEKIKNLEIFNKIRDDIYEFESQK